MPKLPVTIKTISEKQKKEIESIAKERLTGSSRISDNGSLKSSFLAAFLARV